MARVLMLTSHPVAPPWDSADKHLAYTLIRRMEDHRFVVLTRLGSKLPRAFRVPILTRDGRPGVLERAQAAVAGALLEPTVDLVHVVTSIGPGTKHLSRIHDRIPAFARRPVVHTVPGILRDDFLDGLNPLGLTVALSAVTAERLRERGFADVVVIPPGIALDRWQPVPRPTGPPVVLFAGHADDGGGAATTLSAIAEMAAAGSDVEGVVALRVRLDQDEDAELGRIRERTRELGIADRVSVVGHIPDMRPLVAASSVVVLPARDLHGKADVPLIVLEAMATGRPTIVSDLPAFAPLGNVPLRTRIDDAKDVADALDRVLRCDDEFERRASLGRAAVERAFSDVAMARQYAELYDALLPKRAGDGLRVRTQVPADELDRSFRKNLSDATQRLHGAGVTPVLIKAEADGPRTYSNFDLVVGEDGWDPGIAALDGWTSRTSSHPLEPDKILLHPVAGPAAHLHRDVAWFGVPVIAATSVRSRATPSPEGAWLVPAREDALRIAVAHAAFQNVWFEPDDLETIRARLDPPTVAAAMALAGEEGWSRSFRRALHAAVTADGPVRVPRVAAAMVAGEHAMHLWRIGRRSTALRELALRFPLLIAKRRPPPHPVSVIGVSGPDGSGKTTVATELARRSDSPVLHLYGCVLCRRTSWGAGTSVPTSLRDSHATWRRIHAAVDAVELWIRLGVTLRAVRRSGRSSVVTDRSPLDGLAKHGSSARIAGKLFRSAAGRYTLIALLDAAPTALAERDREHPVVDLARWRHRYASLRELVPKVVTFSTDAHTPEEIVDDVRRAVGIDEPPEGKGS
jgi:glycosyltransferase involved in cell wall biosynthesis